jgi:hypothetical protein
MNCPKCGWALNADATESLRCGVVVAKFLRAHEASLESAVDLSLSPLAAAAADVQERDGAARSEQIARAVALPLALAFAWVAVNGSPGGVRMLTMWVHESGHAASAWLCGYAAWPGPWFTPVGTERSPVFTILLLALVAFGGYQAWQRQRRVWIAASAGTVLLILYCTMVLNAGKAQQLIVFGGDGGCFVIGTMLMLTVYAREDHPIRQEHVRWGLLVIGALAFVDAYTVWSGPIDRLPFGENENGLSDPSVLTEIYGWSVLHLINRYGQLARACLVLQAVAYVSALGRGAMFLSTLREGRSRREPSP